MRGSSPGECAPEYNAPTQHRRNNGNANTCITGRRRKQRGGRSGSRMPGDRLNDVGSQQRILNEEARYDEGNDEGMEIVYDKEDREPPDGIGKVALADEKWTEPLAVWYSLIGTTKLNDADHTPNNPNIDANIEGEVEDTFPGGWVDSITSIKVYVFQHTNKKFTLRHDTDTGIDKVEDQMESRGKQESVTKNRNCFEEKAVDRKEL